MEDTQWLKAHCRSLEGKTVAITGPTGGLGVPVCRDLLQLSARLILLSRDREKTAKLLIALKTEFPASHIFWVPLDLSDMDSVRNACKELEILPVDVLIHNGGLYAGKKKRSTTGFLEIFQVNFLSPYYMTRRLLPHLEERKGKVIAVGSIAHGYGRADPHNPDYSGRGLSKIYGNSKRWLMFSLGELMKAHPEVRYAIVHPGLAYTAMSEHFPKAVARLLRWPMKAIYMKPERSARSIVMGIFKKVPSLHWIGPAHFHIWGDPRIEKLRTADEGERRHIYRSAEKMYAGLCQSAK